MKFLVRLLLVVPLVWVLCVVASFLLFVLQHENLSDPFEPEYILRNETAGKKRNQNLNEVINAKGEFMYTHGKKSSIFSLYVMLKSYAGDLSVSIYTHGKKSSIFSLCVMLKSYAGDLSMSISRRI